MLCINGGTPLYKPLKSGQPLYNRCLLKSGVHPANNAKFTTYDNDNDVNIGSNCAVGSGGGWWYYSCYDIHPNHQPPYYDRSNTALFIEMKIHPKGSTTVHGNVLECKEIGEFGE